MTLRWVPWGNRNEYIKLYSPYLWHFALFFVQRDPISLGITETNRLRIHARQHKRPRRLHRHKTARGGIGAVSKDHFSGLHPVPPAALTAMIVGQFYCSKSPCAGVNQYVRAPLSALGSRTVDDRGIHDAQPKIVFNFNLYLFLQCLSQHSF